jgi:dTDP-glucose 4,6-dehydratase
MHLLITGGAGFVGSNFTRLVLAETSHKVTIVDALTYAGNPENLAGLAAGYAQRYRFVRGDVADRAAVDALCSEAAAGTPFDAIVHFAAESHVDRSIHNAQAFLTTNVLGTQSLLDAARAHNIARFLHVGTDEVYGSLGPDDPAFTEATPLAPNSPYAASKASADLLCRAAFETHGQDVVVTRCSNNYGPYQFPEKLIPLMIVRALADEPLPVYGDGMQVRDWLHVEDHCRGLLAALERGTAGRVYNIGGASATGDEAERPNLTVVRAILDKLGKPHSLIRHVTDRKGHDRRYAINARRITEELGWAPTIRFSEGLPRTVDWYVANREWWQRVQTGAYRKWIEQNYGALPGHAPA